MSSNVAATPNQPSFVYASARTTWATAHMRTAPRPSGRLTSNTSRSIGVPGSISWGLRKKTPLELMSRVCNGRCEELRCPATRCRSSGRASRAREYLRRSRARPTVCVGTRAIPLGCCTRFNHAGAPVTVADAVRRLTDFSTSGSRITGLDELATFNSRAMRVRPPWPARSRTGRSHYVLGMSEASTKLTACVANLLPHRGAPGGPLRSFGAGCLTTRNG